MTCHPPDNVKANQYPIRWSEPAIIQRRAVLPQGVAGARVARDALCGADGSWNCCDVILAGIDAEWLDVEVELFALYDGVETLVSRKIVREGSITLTDDGLLAVHLFAVRGMPCRGWRIIATRPLPPAVPNDGFVRMAAWGTDTAEMEPWLAPRRKYDSGANLSADAIGPITAGNRPTRLHAAWIYNAGPGVRFFQLFDANPSAAILPGAAPVWMPIRLAANAHGAISFGEPGLSFEAGVAWRSSTTQATLTGAGGNDFWVSMLYSQP